MDGGLLNDDVSNRLCVFCFRDSPSEESPVLPGQPVSKPPTGLKLVMLGGSSVSELFRQALNNRLRYRELLHTNPVRVCFMVHCHVY